MSQMDDFKREKRLKLYPISKSCYNCICYYCTGSICPWINKRIISYPLRDSKPGRCRKCQIGDFQKPIFDCDYFSAYRYKRFVLPMKKNPKLTRYDILMKRIDKLEQLIIELTKNNS